MKAIYDEDSANTVHFEEKEQRAAIKSDKRETNKRINAAKKRVRNLTNIARRQQAWNNLQAELALEGLSEKELNVPY